ncbi:hypothetical protein T05_5120 [Trichinella murrelli]|uniref:Uncharacterized protein n=1 Tax=Trichinella murrelli TaxID=144512 RepID=A0A0V0TYK9_9BILA|nr:hypothetical protein T05_5120 [Trichinella murrelli]
MRRKRLLQSTAPLTKPKEFQKIILKSTFHQNMVRVHRMKEELRSTNENIVTGVEIQGTAVALSSLDKSPLYIVLQSLNNKCFEKQVLCDDKVEPSKSNCFERKSMALTVIYFTHQISQWEMKLQLDEFKHFSMDDLELSRPIIV